MTTRIRVLDVLLGSIVTLATAPLGLGPAIGGWLAGRNATTPTLATLSGGVAGAVGALPWAWLVYLASAGAIDPIGYHEGYIHVGVNTAAPGTFVLWQELALAGLVGSVIVGAALAGGFVAGLSRNLVGDVQEELTTHR